MMNIPLAYSHLNLRFNPFGEINIETRSKLAVVEVEHLVSSLRKHKTAIQFFADHGRGKTTHLLALYKFFPEANYTKLQKNIKNNLLKKFSKNSYSTIFIDSLEILNKKERKKIFKKYSKIAFTSHNDISSELKQHGFNVNSFYVSNANEEKLKLIFQKRINSARRSPGRVPKITLNTIRFLIKKHNDDIRSMELDLYEKIQSMTGIENV